MIDVIVVIATSMKRTHLLMERSLRSVYTQKGITPLCVYIVDDNTDRSEIHKVKKVVKGLRSQIFGKRAEEQGFFHTRILRNNRTKGHSGSGAWNTAILHAYRVYSRQRKLYIAILDDDDAWYSNYLFTCVSQIRDESAFVAAVVSSFYRIEGNKRKRVVIQQESLEVNNFYKQNPGWQGSNTFVEIKSFFQAGCFDEAMPSTQDRDFAIRFLKMCRCNGYSIRTVQELLWEHYAHAGKRVTTGERKREGLDLFYNKYAAAMQKMTLNESLKRAQGVFNYQKSKEVISASIKLQTSFEYQCKKKIIIGVVSSSLTNVQHQFESLLNQIKQEPEFIGYCTYIVMTNGNNGIKEKLLSLRSVYPQLNIICIDESLQKEMLSRFPFQELYCGESLFRKSIAFSRSLLQFAVWEETQKTSDDTVALILDDDLLFESLMLKNSMVETVKLAFFSKLMYLSEQGGDLLISKYTDAPPLPFYSSIRVQLVDLYYMFVSVLNGGGKKFKNAFQGNVSLCDYYYDLSDSYFQHLETPVYLLSDNKSKEVNLKVLSEKVRALKNHSNVCRPLLFEPKKWNAGLLNDDYHRGGIAIFNDLKLLIKVPHVSPLIEIQGKQVRSRRSDFISTIALKEFHGAIISEVCFPLRHNRLLQNKCPLGKEKIAADILGSQFYRVFLKSIKGHETQKGLQKAFLHGVRDSLTKLETNALRVIQLIQEIIELAEKEQLLEVSRSLKQLMEEYEVRVLKEQATWVRKELEKTDVLVHIERLKELLR
jgi:hypothetical protein